MQPHERNHAPRQIDLVEIRNVTMTCGRVKRLKPQLNGDIFMLT